MVPPKDHPSRLVGGRQRMIVDDSHSLTGIVESYGRFVPQQFLRLLGKDSITEVSLGDHVERTMTVLFSDIRDFTPLSESMTPQQIFGFINSYLSMMEPVVCAHGGVIDKYIGDAIMALFPDGADAAVGGAIDMLHALAQLNHAREDDGAPPVRIGIGLNTGVMMLGTVGGPQRMEGTVISDAVNLGARIESLTKLYGIPLLISEHTYYALVHPEQHDIRFIDRVRVKGKEQPESVYEIYDAAPADTRAARNRVQPVFEEGVAQYHLKNIGESRRLLTQVLDACPDDPVTEVYLARCERYESTGVHEGTGEIDLDLRWRTSLEIAHPQIDAQHRGLFARAQEFVEAMRSSEGHAEVATGMESLAQAVVCHFRDEERFMAEANYPFLSMQKQQHARFLKCFAELKKEIGSDFNRRRFCFLFRMQVLLVDWLINHTSRLDGHFGKHLRLMESTD
jgi:hemerythrin-like metal-binding protein